MDGFEKRKEKKKDSIRRAALELFQSHGFRKVSVAEIARQADVSQVTIYNYFGSREGLIQDVIKWFVGDLMQKYLDLMSSDRPFQEKLEAMVFDKTRMIDQFQGELLTTYIKIDPELRSYVDALAVNQVIPAMNAFFQEGIDQGCIDPKLSTEAIMAYFEIFRRGYYNAPELVEKISKNPDLARELIRLISYGLNG